MPENKWTDIPGGTITSAVVTAVELTKRDWFAGKLLSSVGNFAVSECTDDELLAIARQAYRVADAFVKASEE